MNLLFWGTESIFAHTVLTGLIDYYTPTAVMVPAPAAQVSPVEAVTFEQVTPMISSAASTAQIALQKRLPLYRLHTLKHAALLTLLESIQPDLVVVACFPWRIPPPLLAIPTMGFLNLHPSLLPHYRGPAPLFWQLRDGVRTSGVTLHWMDASFDTGAIAAQQSLLLEEGASGPLLDTAYAKLGVNLLRQVLSELSAGVLPRTSQPAAGSYHSWPTVAEFTLDRAWSAQHAFNFMRGTAEWGYLYSVQQANERYHLSQALFYEPNGQLSQPIERRANQLAIQFAPGILYASPPPTIGQRATLDLVV